MKLYLLIGLVFLLSFALASKNSRAADGRQSPDRAPNAREPSTERVPELKLPENVRLIEDVTYGTGGGRDLHLDLYFPAEHKPSRPAMIFLHGGGWSGGTRKQFAPQSAYLASKGFVAGCIEYRLSGEARFPAAVEDAKCAVRWMRANAGKYGIDPDRMGVGGGSAGAHLAALLGTSAAIAELEGKGGHAEFPSNVNLVVAFNGVFDLAPFGKQLNPVRNFMGGTPEEMPEAYALASPVTHVDKSDPPFLLLHGTQDQVVPHQQSVDFQKRLQSAGVRAELYTAEGAAHGFFNRPPWYQPTLERMEEFLSDCFKLKAGEGK